MEYGVTPLETCLIFVNLLLLAKKTMVWPHPEELFMAGSKLQSYENLRISSLSMGISTPFYVTAGENITDPSFLKAFSQGKIQGVLKRDYSMKCQHVILPTSPKPSLTIKKSLMQEENTWKRVQGLFGMPKWFIQPIVAHLLHVGEVRCFIVSGRLVYKVTTTPGEGLDHPWEITDHDLIRPLHTHV